MRKSPDLLSFTAHQAAAYIPDAEKMKRVLAVAAREHLTVAKVREKAREVMGLEMRNGSRPMTPVEALHKLSAILSWIGDQKPADWQQDEKEAWLTAISELAPELNRVVASLTSNGKPHAAHARRGAKQLPRRILAKQLSAANLDDY